MREVERVAQPFTTSIVVNGVEKTFTGATQAEVDAAQVTFFPPTAIVRACEIDDDKRYDPSHSRWQICAYGAATKCQPVVGPHRQWFGNKSIAERITNFGG
jgi:hypothetical protein